MKNVKTIVLMAMFLSIGLFLPFLTGQIPQIGKMLLPMHIPVLLCGLVCGWKEGLLIGFILPLLRSFLFAMPIFYPSAIGMAFELAAYGAIVGFTFAHAKWKCLSSLYKCLLTAMVGGRVVWGVVMIVLMGIKGNAFTLSAFLAGAFITALPGILLQLILIPSIMLLLDRTHFKVMHHKANKKAEIYE